LTLTSRGQNFGSIGPYAALRYVAVNMLHVPGLRDNPARFYPATQVGDIFPGVFQSYVASIIQSWTDTKDDRLGELGKQLQSMALTWKVATQRIDDTRVALRVGRLPKSRSGGARDLVNIADVGLGVSQILPVLVALLTASRGDWVFVEQPEIHLHPRAQVALADLLIACASRGVFVICETHSYLLLRAIQEAAVRTGAPEKAVGLNWFSRDMNGETHLDSVYLANNGSFGDWPNDFANVEMEIEDRYLQAVLAAEASRR
jgi:predicted ATPase